jgi:hypothetical protein
MERIMQQRGSTDGRYSIWPVLNCSRMREVTHGESVIIFSKSLAPHNAFVPRVNQRHPYSEGQSWNNICSGKLEEKDYGRRIRRRCWTDIWLKLDHAYRHKSHLKVLDHMF